MSVVPKTITSLPQPNFSVGYGHLNTRFDGKFVVELFGSIFNTIIDRSLENFWGQNAYEGPVMNLIAGSR